MKPTSREMEQRSADTGWDMNLFNGDELSQEIQSFISYLNTPLSIYDHQEKKFIYVNQQFLGLSGLTEKDALQQGQLYYGLWIEDEDYHILKEPIRNRLKQFYNAAIHNQAERVSYMINFRFKNKEGSKHMLVQTNVLAWKEDLTPRITMDIYSDVNHRNHSNKILLTVNQFKPFEKVWEMKVEEEFLREPKLLGRREKEVLYLMLEEKSATSIAEELEISVFTVRTHWRNILQKMNCHSQKELKALAYEEGWI